MDVQSDEDWLRLRARAMAKEAAAHACGREPDTGRRTYERELTWWERAFERVAEWFRR